MPAPICTIGYEGKEISSFVDELVAAGVELLVDVRRRPISRKKGFSKRALRGRLADVGIGYLHVPELGMPDDLLPLRDHRENRLVLSEYRQRCSGRWDHVETIADLARCETICLLCFERHHEHCHRGILAEELALEHGLHAHHL